MDKKLWKIGPSPRIGCSKTVRITKYNVSKQTDRYGYHTFYHICSYCGNHIRLNDNELPKKIQDYASSWSQWFHNL